MDSIKIKCQDCGTEFLFSVEEQDFYKSHGFVLPKRCRYCRSKRKQKYNNDERSN